MKRNVLSLFMTVMLVMTVVAGLPVTANAGVPVTTVWVNGIQVTGSNASDILADGTASYDLKNSILTLSNAAITSGAACAAGSANPGIYAERDLTIVLTGSNSIVASDGNLHDYIHVKGGDLTITGSGILSTVHNNTSNCNSVYCTKDKDSIGGKVTFGDDCTVVLTGNYYAILAQKGAYISNNGKEYSIPHNESGDEQFGFANAPLTIKNGKLLDGCVKVSGCSYYNGHYLTVADMEEDSYNASGFSLTEPDSYAIWYSDDTLHLNNVSVIADDCSVITCDRDLTIDVTGSCSLDSNDATSTPDDRGCAVYVTGGSVTITGGGNLTLEAYNYGIYANGTADDDHDISVRMDDGGSITAAAGTAFRASRDVTISAGAVTLTGSTHGLYTARGTLKMSGGSLNASVSETSSAYPLLISTAPAFSNGIAIQTATAASISVPIGSPVAADCSGLQLYAPFGSSYYYAAEDGAGILAMQIGTPPPADSSYGPGTYTLSRDTCYTLSSDYTNWRVTAGPGAPDGVTYRGGIPFYVLQAGTYTFTASEL